tara:strand:- start:1271 stop:1699 length:429 start_codon:yes stop_codon:yes gene_type:complete
MSNNKLKIQVGKKAFTEIITYGKDDQKFEWCAVTRKVDILVTSSLTAEDLQKKIENLLDERKNSIRFYRDLGNEIDFIDLDYVDGEVTEFYTQNHENCSADEIDELWQGPESEGNELDFEDNDFDEIDSDYEINFIDGVVSD